LDAPAPLRAEHELADFSSGVPPLDDWLRRHALYNEIEGGSRTYVTAAGLRVAGYYSLAAGSLRKELASGRVRRNMPEPVPVVLLGRLAVDRQWQGAGLGAFLLRDAVLRMAQAARTIGVRAMLVHAISDTAKAFYEHNGFHASSVDPMSLMITVAEAERALMPTGH
jgi:GNAT superfamily N-acetyltransferase